MTDYRMTNNQDIWMSEALRLRVENERLRQSIDTILTENSAWKLKIEQLEAELAAIRSAL